MNYPFEAVLTVNIIAEFIAANPDDEAVQDYLACEPRPKTIRDEQSDEEGQGDAKKMRVERKASSLSPS